MFAIAVFLPTLVAWMSEDLLKFDRGLLLGLVGFVVMLTLTWFVIYMLCAFYWTARTCCWIGEFHPLLAPVVSTVLVIFFVTYDLITHDPKGLSPGAWMTLTISGAATTLLLAAAEYNQLRSKHIGWRTGRRANSPSAARPFRL